MNSDRCYVCGRNAREVQAVIMEAVAPTIDEIRHKIAERRTQDKQWSDSLQTQVQASLAPLRDIPDAVKALKWSTAQADSAVLGDQYPFRECQNVLHYAGTPIHKDDTVGDVLRRLSQLDGTHIGKPEIQKAIEREQQQGHRIEWDASPENEPAAFVEVELPLSDVLSPFGGGNLTVTLCRICSGLRDRDLRAAANRREEEEAMANDW